MVPLDFISIFNIIMDLKYKQKRCPMGIRSTIFSKSSIITLIYHLGKTFIFTLPLVKMFAAWVILLLSRFDVLLRLLLVHIGFEVLCFGFG